ncbi:MAG: hypothetical protein GW748_00005 [Alphaproteobacteria bacterium]|nr:hypothetical protein [Alphaproteobacteria bacterium]
MNNLKANFFFISLFASLHINTAGASTPAENQYSFEEQLAVAVQRQIDGTPFVEPFHAHEKEQWNGFFNEAIRLSKTVVEQEQESIGDDRKAELSEMLRLVEKKGENLFSEDKMNTNRYLFLHLMMGEVLSIVHEGMGAYLQYDSMKGRIFYREPRDFQKNIDQLENVLLVREQGIEEVRAFMSNYTMDFSGIINTEKDIFRITIDSKEIEFRFSFLDSCYFLTMDSFFLPYIGSKKQVLYSIKTLNKALAHRVSPIGFPTLPSNYDANTNAAASTFALHDLSDHAVPLFQYFCNQTINEFNPEKDPLLKLMHPLWIKIEGLKDQDPNKYQSAQVAFFRGFHEFGFPYNFSYIYDQRTEETDRIHFEKLENTVKSKELSWPCRFELDFESKETYYKKWLRFYDLEIIGFLNVNELQPNWYDDTDDIVQVSIESEEQRIELNNITYRDPYGHLFFKPLVKNSRGLWEEIPYDADKNLMTDQNIIFVSFFTALDSFYNMKKEMWETAWLLNRPKGSLDSAFLGPDKKIKNKEDFPYNEFYSYLKETTGRVLIDL